jgi:hypothetical protein
MMNVVLALVSLELIVITGLVVGLVWLLVKRDDL